MSKILITGKNSYIGTEFAKFVQNEHECNFLSLRDDNWKNVDFSKYDTLLHVAGIAHIKESKENTELYYKINRDLSLQLAKKAKEEKVPQFIFMSSMSVYGKIEGEIDENTPLNPSTNYGESKFEAEKLIQFLQDDSFKVCVIRPPMVYGKNCKGNFQSLIKIAKKLPFFPNIKNTRSMIYIDNLSCFINLMIKNREKGIFCPQNTEYVNTAKTIELIAEKCSKKIKICSFLNPFVKIFGLFLKQIKKAFGSLTYDKKTSKYKENYNIVTYEESIKRSL